MKTKLAFAFFILFTLGLLFAGIFYVQTNDIAVLNPKGLIAAKERSLFSIITLLMLIVVVPVFVMTAAISWLYRAGNKKASYKPKWDHSTKAEMVWWGVPFLIIAVIGVITWKGCHELDPFKPLEHPKKPLKVQVIALQWKWLFIYPEQQIASLNYLRIPENRPIYFEITSDAPMNSFWIPQLGGQIYAMAGMKTKLYLIANEVGQFRGSSANLSGKGFASMNFITEATKEEDFQSWVMSAQDSEDSLSTQEYAHLMKPSIVDRPHVYQLADETLFEDVVMKYLKPAS